MQIEKERKIRDMLNGMESIKKIAFHLNISADTVIKRKRMYKSLDSISEEKLDEVRKLLAMGTPAGKVEIMLQIPVKTIRHIQLFDEIMDSHKEPEATVCPECGSLSWPGCQTGYTRKFRNDYISVNSIDDIGIMELRGVVLDLLCLGDLHVISNPLFYDLFRKADEVIERIKSNA
jgi:hypothetical protein